MSARLKPIKNRFQYTEILTDPKEMERLVDDSGNRYPDIESLLTDSWHDGGDDTPYEPFNDEARWDEVVALMQSELTPRQYRAVYMYFFEDKTEREIGEALGVTQKTIAECLFGKQRNGKRIGGAIARLRTAMTRETPPKKGI